MNWVPSIRALSAMIVAAPIIVVAAALLTLSSITSYRVAESLGRELLTSAADRAAAEVRGYLGAAVRTSDLYLRRIRDGSLPTTGLAAWEPLMLQDLAVSPDVASICFGNTDGEATWLLRGPARLEVGRVAAGANDRAVEAEITSDGQVLDPPLKIHHYDPRQRPWYATATSTLTPVWTPVYFWFGESGAAATTGTGYTRTVRNPDGSVRGVLVIDVTLEALSAFLARSPFARDGQLFLIDDRGTLIAASDGSAVTSDGSRLEMADSLSPAAKAAAPIVATTAAEIMGSERIVVDGEPSRLIVRRIAPYPGVSWRIVGLLPERVFLSDARAMQRRSIWLALTAILGGLAVAWLVSRRVSAPLEALTDHVRRVAKGDFEHRLGLRGARELRELSSEMNRTAGQLRERIALEQSMAVAVEVQKSLLPARDPNDAALEIVGRSTYCDAAGGDYFDFLEAAPVARGRTLIAVGDVMGHGIGAALLMASARAALRAVSAEPGGLAGAMNAVNRVLSADARHHQFMTMLLLVIDHERMDARWASAGHDPAIVYRRSDDSFTELEGGGLPLGVMGDEMYEELSRDGLAPGDLVFVGTDGVWEAMNAASEHYGKDRLRNLLRERSDASCAAIADALQADLDRFRGGAPWTDDVTFVVARLKHADDRPA